MLFSFSVLLWARRVHVLTLFLQALALFCFIRTVLYKELLQCIDGMKVTSKKNQPLRYDELAAISVVKMVSCSWLLTTLWWIHFHARDGLLFQKSLIETWSSYFQKFKVLLDGKSYCSILQSHFLFAVASLCIFSKAVWVGIEGKVKLTTLEKLEKIEILPCYSSLKEVWPCISWYCGVGWKSLPHQHACISKLQPGFSLSFTEHSHWCAIMGHLLKNSACYFWHTVKRVFVCLFYFGFRLIMKRKI